MCWSALPRNKGRPVSIANSKNERKATPGLPLHQSNAAKDKEEMEETIK